MSPKIKNMCFAALGAAVLCVVSPVSLPVGAVPVTLSLFAVLLVSGVLPSGAALAATLVYVALGAVGVPVFAGFVGGFQVLAGPTGGFILGYIPTALLVSLFRRSVKLKVVFMVLSATLCYIMGSLWLSLTTETSFAATLCSVLVTCAIPDALKISASAILSDVILKRLPII